MPTAESNNVRTWYAERGQGRTVLVLHPGGVDSRALTPTVDGLAEHFRVITPDRRGHGRTPDVDGPITYELMAQDTIDTIETLVGGPTHLVGYSDGAVVALLVALHRPDLVPRLVLVAGVFHRDGWHAADATVAEPPDFFKQSYGELSPDGIDHFDVVLAKLNAMHAAEPALDAEDLQAITSRTLVMVGDDDEVSLEHATATYRSLRAGELAVVPGTSHGLLVEKPELCNRIITDFLANEPVPTFAPIRRADPAT